jgi:hypothetical protein
MLGASARARLLMARRKRPKREDGRIKAKEEFTIGKLPGK